MRWPDIDEHIRRSRVLLDKTYTRQNPKICFAWFPMHQDNQWIWWEYYAKYYEHTCSSGWGWHYRLIDPEDLEAARKGKAP